MTIKKFSEFINEDLNAILADPDEQTGAAAKRMGVKHVGFGKYADKTGNITHKAVNGKLTSVDKASMTNSSASSNASLTALTKTFGKQTKEIHNLLINTYVPDAYSNEELESIKTYTDRAYVDINDSLSNIENADNDQLAYYVQNIDSALAKGQTPAPFNIFFILEGDAQFEPGNVIMLYGFRSGTINPDVAIQHSKTSTMPIIMQVAVPMKSPGMYIEDYSVSPEEYEFVLARGSTIRIDAGPKTIAADDGEITFYSCTLVSE
jgi:hypothetical protein